MLDHENEVRDTDSESEFEDDVNFLDQNLIESGKRKRKRVNWSYVCTYPNHDEAYTEVKADWSSKKSNQTKTGIKDYYRCKISPKCKSEIYLLYLSTDERVSKFTNNVPHDHSYLNDCPRGIHPDVEQIISDLYQLGVTGPLKIIYTLRAQKVQNIPTQKQLYNFNSILKKQIYGKTTMNYADLEQACRQRVNYFYKTDNEAFILDYYIDAQSQTFRIAFSTKKLLNICQRAKILCVDATYKLNYQGFLFLIAGTLDFSREFHPICVAVTSDEKTESAHVELSVCWAHAQRAISNKIKNIQDEKIESNLMNDIYLLQLSNSKLDFEIKLKLFNKKWELIKKKYKNVEAFFDYFDTQWIRSVTKNWYEGVAAGLPSTNNSLEANNNSIKNVHTFRERLSLPIFLQKIEEILFNWSSDRGSIKFFTEKPFIGSEIWALTQKFIDRKPKFLEVEQKTFLVCYSDVNDEALDLLGDLLECNEECLDCFDILGFDKYSSLTNFIKVVRLAEDWTMSTCTCYSFFKFFMCKHIAFILLKKGIISLDPKYINVGCKTKPGPKKKAKKWFFHQLGNFDFK
ncbi:unnamed protein product [Brachionus calyciflorus]|uniref:SWIM-type domain-containing protein n=1 Tax=Brachionus calyciflorus TaxID=104777 RepID=A0A814GQ71_9BILA|nr:unnamed protein product [Brachionus calyciflorus]